MNRSDNSETSMTAKLFIGIPVPDSVRNELRQVVGKYKEYTESVIPEERWHITFLFMGEVKTWRWYAKRMNRVMPQAYLPCASISYVGRGLQRGQLWAYVQPTESLKTIHEQLIKRVGQVRAAMDRSLLDRYFSPHINLAKLYGVTRGIGIADTPLIVTWPFNEVYIYRSEQGAKGPVYSVVEEISLRP